MTSLRRTRPAGRTAANRGPKRTRPAVTDPRNNELSQRIREAIEPIVVEAGLFLEEAVIGRAGSQAVVRVVIDLPSGPGGVGSDLLTDVSRNISAKLDAVDLVEGSYTLEVSTPGAERFLTEPRHFSRAQGRLVDVETADGSTFKGRLLTYVGDTVTVLVDDAEREISLSDVTSARVRVDMSGAGRSSEGEED